MASHPSSLRAIITPGTRAKTRARECLPRVCVCAVRLWRADDPAGDQTSQRGRAKGDAGSSPPHPHPPELLCVLGKLTPSLRLIRRRIRIVCPSSPLNGSREGIPAAPLAGGGWQQIMHVGSCQSGDRRHLSFPRPDLGLCPTSPLFLISRCCCSGSHLFFGEGNCLFFFFLFLASRCRKSKQRHQ